jgi:hypothetical protein
MRLRFDEREKVQNGCEQRTRKHRIFFATGWATAKPLRNEITPTVDGNCPVVGRRVAPERMQASLSRPVFDANTVG